MRLVVGLGNPGPEYNGTRHNVGFDVLDRLARRIAPGAVARARFQGACIEADLEGDRALLLKPGSFMNRSGQSVADAARFYKIDVAKDLMVVVDDVALECGNIRLRPEGSAGGHNGLVDVERLLATTVYPRLRIGIDAPGGIPQKDYVLGRFRPDQRERLEPALESAVEAVRVWALAGLTEAMNRFNKKNAPSSANNAPSPIGSTPIGPTS